MNYNNLGFVDLKDENHIFPFPEVLAHVWGRARRPQTPNFKCDSVTHKTQMSENENGSVYPSEAGEYFNPIP